jgi:hypothetical protein
LKVLRSRKAKEAGGKSHTITRDFESQAFRARPLVSSQARLGFGYRGAEAEAMQEDQSLSPKES